MKNTHTKEFRAIVQRYLLDSIIDDTQPNDKARAQYIFDQFTAEYDYPDNRVCSPNRQKRVSQWLAGLALNIAYSYSDIIELSEQWHECKLTDKQADKLVDEWFNFMAFKLIQLWGDYKIKGA